MTSKPLTQAFGERLKEVMADRQINNRELARRSGVGDRTIANYLRDAKPQTTGLRGKTRSAKLFEIDKLAQGLGVSPIELLTDQADLERLAYRLGARALLQVAESVGTAYNASPVGDATTQGEAQHGDDQMPGVRRRR